jgi:TonB-dependent SusC/RagA subfamily outer membrane receptor
MRHHPGICTVSLRAESGTVQGKVTDKQTGAALSGARVLLKSSGSSAVIGKVTSKTGDYSISAPPGDYTFQVTYIGYKTYSTAVKVENNSVASISPQLLIDVKGVDEIVVTGVASRRERGVSEVSVGRLDASKLTETNKYTDIGQVLTGKISGVRIGQSTGQAGNGFYIRSRGGTGLFGGAPLVFVDGVRMSSANFLPEGFGYGGQNFSALAGLNPDDIENIEVLKGPAGSALYGTSGQNGVVLITTKSGKIRGGAQDELKINYQLVSGWSEPHRKYTTDMFATAEDINRVYRTAPLTQNSLNLTGTSGIFSYYAGMERRNEQGIMKKNAFERTSIRANFDAVTSKNFTFGFRSNYVENFTSMPNNDNSIYGWIGNTIAANKVSGPYSFLDSTALEAMNEYLSTKRFIGSVEVNFLPSQLPELQMRGIIGIDNFSTRG